MDGVNPAASGAQASNRDAIADEFELHVQQCAEQLQREGLSPAQARAEAERRFGDMARHHEQCRREAPEERVNAKVRWMMFAGLGVQAVAITALVLLVARQGRTIDEFQQRMRSNEDRMQVMGISSPELQAVDRAAFAAGATLPVQLEGRGVARRGSYDLPESGTLSLNRLLMAAGVRAESGRSLAVRVLPSRGGEATVERWQRDGLAVRQDGLDGPWLDIMIDERGAQTPLTLRGGELVIVVAP